MILGRIRMLACPYVPVSMLACNGQTISANDYPELVQLLGGSTTATLPTIPGPVPGVTWMMDAGGSWPSPSGWEIDYDPPIISELVTFTSMANTYTDNELLLCDGSSYPFELALTLASLLQQAFPGPTPGTFTTPKVPGPTPQIQYFIVANGGMYPAPPTDAAATPGTTTTSGR